MLESELFCILFEILKSIVLYDVWMNIFVLYLDFCYMLMCEIGKFVQYLDIRKTVNKY